jgi:hypothetical protein
MAAAFTIVKRRPDMRENIVDMTADTSYPANGYPVAAADVGLLSIDSIECYQKGGAGNLAVFDPAASKIKIMQTGAALSGAFSEAVAGDLTTADVFRLVAKGDPRL